MCGAQAAPIHAPTQEVAMLRAVRVPLVVALVVCVAASAAAFAFPASNALAASSPVPHMRVDMHGARAYASAAGDAAGGAAWDAAGIPAGGPATGTHASARPTPPESNWIPLGPFGGDVQAVGVSPANANLMFAGLAPSYSGNGKLFRSTNGGTSWVESTSMAGKSFYDLAFTPAGTAYLGTTESVWKSTDNGNSWLHLNLNIGLNDVVLAVTVDPTNASTIWAGVSDAMGNQTQTVLKSTNGGSSWTNKTPAMSPMACQGISVDPANANKVYASFGGDFGGGSVWVSTNGGTSWTNRSSGLPTNPMNDIVKVGARLYVCGGLLFGTQEVGLYVSTNDGANWTPLHSAQWPSRIIRDMDIDPNNAAVLLVGSDGRGVFKSTDSGATWSYGIGGSGSFSVRTVRYAPASSTRIVLGLSSLGVFQSTDSGGQFLANSNGIGALNIYSVASNPASPNEIAISFQGDNDGGIYTSLDNGQTWTLENCPGTRWNTVAFNGLGTLHAISDGPTSIAPEGVWRRAPDSGIWSCLGPDQGTYFESELNALTFSHTNDLLILAGGADFGVAGYEGTCWLSTDAGTTWTKAYESIEPNEMVYDIWLVEDGTDQQAVGCFSDYNAGTGGALVSTNGGANWKSSSAGLPANARGVDLDAFPGEPNTIYYADAYYENGYGGLFKTTDAGQTWASAGYGGWGSVGAVVCDPERPGTIYVTRPDPEKVLISTDGGATFGPFNNGLTFLGQANRLAHASGPSRLLLATTTGACATVLIDPAAVDDAPVDLGGGLAAYPNPVPAGQNMQFRITGAGRNTFRAYDATGRLVRTLRADGPTLSWDGRDETGAKLPAGVYLVRTQTGQAAKVQLLQ
jgi:photosystem II stability/assembly factor-like uncharacterized protein